jgi:hypothetical protein
MPKLMKRWQKWWFYLRNNANAPLPMFTGTFPIPHPNWGYGVVEKDLSNLQPLHDVIQWLWWERLMGMHLLRTFFYHRI